MPPATICNLLLLPRSISRLFVPQDSNANGCSNPHDVVTLPIFLVLGKRSWYSRSMYGHTYLSLSNALCSLNRMIGRSKSTTLSPATMNRLLMRQVWSAYRSISLYHTVPLSGCWCTAISLWRLHRMNGPP